MKKSELLNLRPTQFVLGMKEVESKISRIQNFSKKEWTQYCQEHVVPVVHGWDHQYYLIDHHHFIRACWETDHDDYEIKVIKDLSSLNEEAFWKEMIQRGWTYLRDQFGQGPHAPQALPMDIRCLADDPYRSLVWSVIDHGAIEKQSVPFFEFKWAEYFRKNMDFTLHSKSDFKDATAQAIQLTSKSAAQHLPGYK